MLIHETIDDFDKKRCYKCIFCPESEAIPRTREQEEELPPVVCRNTRRSYVLENRDSANIDWAEECPVYEERH